MMRFIRKRGVSSAISILLALAAMAIAVRNDGGNTLLWYFAAGFFVVIAIACWFIVPPADQPSIKVKNSPNATVRGNVSREDLGSGIEVENSPGADINVNAIDEDGATVDGDQTDS